MLKYLRYILVGLIILSLMFLSLFFLVLRPKNIKNSDFWVPKLGKLALWILGLKVELKNKENMLNNRPCIFISNHQSNIDTWTLAAVLPSGGITLGKKSILYLPIFGLFYYLCGNFLIDRKDKAASKEKIKDLITYLKNNQLSLWVMPEGTRSKGRGILPFKKGPFYLAIGSGLPIVPICISSYEKSFNLNKFKSGTIVIEALPAISTKELQEEDVGALADKSREMIIKGVKKLNLEIMPECG